MRYTTTTPNGHPAKVNEINYRHKAYAKMIRHILGVCSAIYELAFNEPAPK